MTENKLSRRLLLQNAAAAGVCVLSVCPAAGQGFTKSPQKSASYQDRPNGEQRCGNCMHFQPPSSCKVVAGRIGPNGWCRIYAARQG